MGVYVGKEIFMCKGFTAYVKDLFKSDICNFEGKIIYTYDIAYKIHKEHKIEAAGSDYTSYIQSWFRDCMDFYDYEMCEFGKSTNPLENPQQYFYRIVMLGLVRITDLCIYEKGLNSNDKIEITADFIDTVCKYVDGISDSYRLFF